MRVRLSQFGFGEAIFVAGSLMAVLVAGDLAWRGLHQVPISPVWDIPDADPVLGRQAIVRHGCGGCHNIPGVRNAVGRVGPRLAGIREQMYLAGVLPNIPENLIVWIQAPQDISPQTAMPNLQVTETEARHIAAYLYGLP